MNEKLLQYIWQFQHYNRTALITTSGAALTISKPGRLNVNQGPDFIDARIIISGTTWAGAIELHVNTSDWVKHGHDLDPIFQNIILHVVWNHDVDFYQSPVLELKNLVPKVLLEKYGRMMLHASFIPCGDIIGQVREITWTSWMDRMIAERLNVRFKQMLKSLETNKFHWEETCWQSLARSYGMKVNGDAFEAMAKSIPLQILNKHRYVLIQLEALLLGQANLLNREFKGSYPNLLQNEYSFLKKKFNLQQIREQVKHLRMRPGNFPELRLAQLATVIFQNPLIFSILKNSIDLHKIMGVFAAAPNDYWNYHFQLDTSSVYKIKYPGDALIQSIIINTVTPLLYTFGKYYGNKDLAHRAFKWLKETKTENNQIVRFFKGKNMKICDAADSQAILHLYNNYCLSKRCLDCAIGNELLKKNL